MKRLLLVTSLLALSGPLHAGGPVTATAEPPVAPAAAAPTGADWTGFYAGVSLTNGTVNDSSQDFGTTGYGVQVGYLRDLGKAVIGGELSYSKGDYGDDAPGSDWDATRLKLIGGLDAGRILPYAFVGMTNYSINQTSPISDSMTNYGLGARLSVGSSGKLVAGLEYLREAKDNFGDSGQRFENDELAVRLDFRF